MNILIITQYYPPEMGAAAARLSGMAYWLKRYGNQVQVITGLPNYPHGKLYPGYRPTFFHSEIINGIATIRTWVHISTSKSSFFRLLNYFSFMLSSVIAGLRLKRRFDIVIASSPPLFVGLSGWALAKIWKIPLLFDIRDLWPDVAVEAGEFSESAPIVKLGEKVARFVHSESRYLTPVTELKREKLIAAGQPPAKIRVIPNGIDLDFLSLPPGNRPLLPFKQNGKFVILYAGLLGIAQGLELIIEAAKRIDTDQSIQFVILGDGPTKPRLQKLTDEYGLDNVTFMNSVPRDRIPAYFRDTDLAIIPLASKKINDAIPSKLLEAWGFKTAVLLIAAGESKKLVDSVKGGWSVEPGDFNLLADKIKTIVAHQDRLSHCALKGYDYVTQKLDRSRIIRDLHIMITGNQS